MIYTLGQEQVYAETVRRMAFSAHYGDKLLNKLYKIILLV